MSKLNPKNWSIGHTTTDSIRMKKNKVDPNNLDRFGWNRWTWMIHRKKAKLLFAVLLIAIIVIIAMIVIMLNKGECQAKKDTLSILVAGDVLLIFISYRLVWPYTQWTSSNPSEFTGYNQIAMNQAMT